MDLPQFLYTPIQPYQTRIVRLHGHRDCPDDALRCDLLVAYLVHDKFEGIAVRLPSGEEQLVPFEALSYTWGGEATEEHIICNGAILPIGKNLFEALRHLRPADATHRHLWVDAICLNQKDAQEKGSQIENMFMIYQKASVVNAWLGSALEVAEDMEQALKANVIVPHATEEPLDDALENFRSVDSYLSQIDEDNFWRIYRVMKFMYTRPWFGRIWVQQEVFAARKLIFQCGPYRFHWPELFSKPEILQDSSHLSRYTQKPQKPDEKGAIPSIVSDSSDFSGTSDASGGFTTLDTLTISPISDTPDTDAITIPDGIFKQLDAVEELESLHSFNLQSFEELRIGGNPDLIEVLLTTSTLGATNPLDLVYGIAGITQFPMKPASIENWLDLRLHSIFVPIDYDAHINVLLSALTWAIIMHMGLGVVAKFKIFDKEEIDCKSASLPTWAIDWKLASLLFRRNGRQLDDLSDPTSERLTLSAVYNQEASLMKHGVYRLDDSQLTVQHWFREDNMHKPLPWNKIRVRGIINTKIRLQGDEARETRYRGWTCWKLGFTAKPEDIVVHLAPYDGVGPARRGFGIRLSELWIIRRVAEDIGYCLEPEYELMACLSHVHESWSGLYRPWLLNDDPTEGDSNISRTKSQYRPLSVDPVGLHGLYYNGPKRKAFKNCQQFIVR